MIKRIDHIGIAVSNIDQVLDFYRDALGLEMTLTEREEGQKSIVAFISAGDDEIELVEPMTADSPVGKFIQKRGEGMHHICFEVDDIEAMLARLVAHGVQLIDEKPYIGTGGKRIAFIHPKAAHGVLIELYERAETETRPPLIDLSALRRMWDVETEAAREGAKAFLRSLQGGNGEH